MSPAAEIVLTTWFGMILFEQLVFKHWVLKRLRTRHADIWERMGRPTIFSVAESHWMLLGLRRSKELAIRPLLDGPEAAGTLKLLNAYRAFTFANIAMAILFLFLLYKD